MKRFWERLRQAVEEAGAAASVRVVEVRGSAPREPGAAVVVRPDGGFWGTIGGGALEWEAIAAARDVLGRGRGPALRRDWPLGPDLGQCCGGIVATLTETFDQRDLADLARFAEAERTGRFFCRAVMLADRRVGRSIAADRPPGPEGASWLEAYGDAPFPVALFGAGHVGRALALALAPLPVAVDWIDPRPEAFPGAVPRNAAARLEADPASAVRGLPAGSAVLVMTHSHPLDLAIVAAAMARADLGPVGLIGSATKRARFLSRLRAVGHGDAAEARLVCPIGLPGIAGKEPAVIAASVAAQVLLWRERASRDLLDRSPTGDDDGTTGRTVRAATRRANPAAQVRLGRGRRAGGRS
jgi:xanthine dehydrogenase accessory factor